MDASLCVCVAEGVVSKWASPDHIVLQPELLFQMHGVEEYSWEYYVEDLGPATCAVIVGYLARGTCKIKMHLYVLWKNHICVALSSLGSVDYFLESPVIRVVVLSSAEPKALFTYIYSECIRGFDKFVISTCNTRQRNRIHEHIVVSFSSHLIYLL